MGMNNGERTHAARELFSLREEAADALRASISSSDISANRSSQQRQETDRPSITNKLPQLDLVDSSGRDPLDHAARLMTERAEDRWGKANVHLSGKDPMASFSTYILGPGVYKLIGPEHANAIAREAVVLGCGFARGAAAEAAKHDLPSLAVRAFNNAKTGHALAAIAEITPAGAAVVGTGFTMAAAYHEFGPDRVERNRTIGDVWNRNLHDQPKESVMADVAKVAHVAGKDCFNDIFDITTGGLDYKAARPIAKLGRTEIPFSDLRIIGNRFQNALEGRWSNLRNTNAKSSAEKYNRGPAISLDSDDEDTDD